MKFKTASILGLIIPLSIALMLTAFLGCGGGGNPYGNAQAYDGTWYLNLQGYALPPATTPPTGTVSCTEDPNTTVVIDHGFGKATELLICQNALPGPWVVEVDVTITPDATGTTGTVKAITTGGAVLTGVCIDRVACQGTNLWLRKQ
jgi:hypothetical protein